MFSAQVIHFLCGDAFIPTYLPTNQPSTVRSTAAIREFRSFLTISLRLGLSLFRVGISHRRVLNSKNKKKTYFLVVKISSFFYRLRHAIWKIIKFQGHLQSYYYYYYLHLRSSAVDHVCCVALCVCKCVVGPLSICC